MSQCPSVATLEAFLSEIGESGDVRSELESHLESCQICQNRLEQLTSHPTWHRYLPSDGRSSLVKAINASRALDSIGDLGSYSRPNVELNLKTSETESNCNKQIPGLTLLEEIGRGGMGVVYRAHQHALNRKVALKMLTSSAAQNPERWVRFGIEAEAIGRLQHPNIVRVFDSGEHDGFPFVVQELAESGSLEQRTAGNLVAPQEAARWIGQLADAVDHAHQHGVLHRDIKPSNILFAGETIKLADFGLAKLVDRNDLTETHDIIGTPAYMAPEQAKGDRDAIGPATDIFSLGILLYELLTGVAPFRADTAVETIRLVNDHDPVSPRQLQPGVDRDLSTICLNCLNKMPAERYQSAAALSDDLRRYRDGHPILAKPPGMLQRAWKWSRRRPVTAALLLVSVTAAIALLGMWARFTNQVASLNKDLITANHSLQQEKEEAERQRNSALAVRAFLADDLLQQANASNQIQSLKQLDDDEVFERDPRVSTLVRRAAKRLEGDGLEQRFPEQTEVQMETLGIIGDVFYSLGKYEEAANLFERAVLLQPESTELTEKQWRLWNYLALQYSNQGRSTEAIERFQWLLEKLKHSDRRQAVATVQHNLGGTYFISGQLEAALEHVRHAVDVAIEAYGPDHIQTLAFKSTLGGILNKTGQHEAALEVLQSVLAGFEPQHGQQHPRTISVRSKVAQTLQKLKRLEESLVLFRRVVADAVVVLSAEHPQTMFYRREMATCLEDMDRYTDAIAEYKQVLAFHQSHFGPDHAETQRTRKWLNGAEAANE